MLKIGIDKFKRCGDRTVRGPKGPPRLLGTKGKR